jgi:hypothetical protein
MFSELAMEAVIAPRGLISLRISSPRISLASLIPQDVHRPYLLLPPRLPHLHPSRPARA